MSAEANTWQMRHTHGSPGDGGALIHRMAAMATAWQ